MDRAKQEPDGAAGSGEGRSGKLVQIGLDGLGEAGAEFLALSPE